MVEDASPKDTAPESEHNDLLTDIIGLAVDQGATDIHIDGWHGRVMVRYRVDGLIHSKQEISAGQSRRIVNQIKVLARLGIEATTAPLEGAFRWDAGGATRDVRVTIIPTAPHYEGVHLRLLVNPNRMREFEHLGLPDQEFAAIKETALRPQGLVLIAGPTGSGKTTTMYAISALEELRDRIIVSIEEPAEFDLPFVRQLEVNHKRGVTMELGLRTLLRMDPDILLVGEIRDHESAAIVAQAAMAGRLVLATVHAHDAAGAIMALNYLSVPFPVLAGALRMVIAQNLVRKICKQCARTRALESAERVYFERFSLAAPKRVSDARGCSACSGYGYKGRAGVFQIAELNDDWDGWLSGGPDVSQIRERIASRGTPTLAGSALQLVSDGVTSIAEVVRLFSKNLGDPSVQD